MSSIQKIVRKLSSWLKFMAIRSRKMETFVIVALRTMAFWH